MQTYYVLIQVDNIKMDVLCLQDEKQLPVTPNLFSRLKPCAHSLDKTLNAPGDLRP